MRAALVTPAWAPEEIFPARTAASQINYWQPLGTLYVAASLRQAGLEVAFLNGAFLTRERILRDLAAFAPRIVGLYATAFGWPKARAAAADVRRILPGACIVAGGPYPIHAQGACLEEAGDLDAVVTGEGEDAMVEIAARVSGGADLAGVAGVAFRRGGEVVVNEPRPLAADLDRLPFPARDLQALDQARIEEYIRTFVDEGELVKEMIQGIQVKLHGHKRSKSQDQFDAYLDQLIQAFSPGPISRKS